MKLKSSQLKKRLSLVFYIPLWSQIASAQIRPPQTNLPDAGSLMHQAEQSSPFRRTIPDYLPPKEALPPEMDLTQAKNYAFALKSFHFNGNKLVKTPELMRILSPIVGKDVTSNDDLKAILDLVVARYRQDGWIVKAYLPTQILENGDLIIQVVENVPGSGTQR